MRLFLWFEEWDKKVESERKDEKKMDEKERFVSFDGATVRFSVGMSIYPKNRLEKTVQKHAKKHKKSVQT